MGLLGAALRFRHAGWRVTFLGARTPVEHVARTARVLNPELIAVSLVRKEGAAAYLRELKTALPEGMQVVAGGMGSVHQRGLAAKLGFQVLAGPEDWPEVLKQRR